MHHAKKTLFLCLFYTQMWLLHFDNKPHTQAFNEYYNSEHSRSLNMWRDVVAVKRLYQDMQVSVRSEMSRMQSHILAASRDLSGACSAVSSTVRHTQQSGETAQQLADRTNDDLRQQIGDLRGQYASTRLELQDREQRLQALLADLKVCSAEQTYDATHPPRGSV